MVCTEFNLLRLGRNAPDRCDLLVPKTAVIFLLRLG